jgi:hypothetical protein
VKKVGLITYYGDNYGGALQAYALQQKVLDNDFECELISNEVVYRFGFWKRMEFRWNSVKTILKNPFTYFSKRNTYQQSNMQLADRASAFAKFRQEHLRIHQTGYTSYQECVKNPPRYDVYLCGSDQIWNPNLYNENGFYFAGFAPNDALKISYASSIGASTVTKKQAKFMAPFLHRLDVIATREQKGAEIIKEITGRDARVVLDPTLLLNGEDWSLVSAPRLIQEPYVFCYLFGEREYIETVKQQVKEMTGMKLVCIPLVAREMSSEDEKIFDAGPAEFISLIQHASLVLTDSFHATAFSVNVKTPFLSLCRFAKNDKKGMNDRLVTLLSAVGLTDRLVDADDTHTKDFLFDVDFEKAHELLEEKREIDSQFLTDALHGRN